VIWITPLKSQIRQTSCPVAAPVLYHIEISHYNEKARWALDYKGVSHERKAPPPMFHTFWALALTRRPTFPVLKLNGKAIGDSTRIIEALERQYPEPPLYPDDPIERRRALDLEDWFDEELGPYIRRWIFHEALQHLTVDEFVEGALTNSPAPVKRMMRASGPVVTRTLKLRYGINPEKANAAREKTRAAFDKIEAEVQPSGYLVGDVFTVADLTAAALTFPLVRPPEAPHRFKGAFPEPVERFRDELSSRPSFKWVEEIYRKHRGVSVAIP
jgi:glutathione S-transferase